MDPAFAELVKAGRYRKVSASFYPPAAKANPRPGSYYLKHVGFLGAQPPAVKGLKAIAFSEEADAETVEVEIAFGEAEAWGFGRIARLFRGLREHFIEKDGLETADRLVPAWELDGLTETAARAREGGVPAFAEPTPAHPDAGPIPAEEEDAMSGDPKTLEARQAELDARAAALAEREAAFAEREAAARRAEDEELVGRLVEEGRMAPALKADALAFMEAIDGDEEISFAEGGAQTPRAWFRELLARSGTLIEFGEVSAPEPGAQAVDRNDPAAIEAAARRHQKRMEEEGRTVSFAEAVRAVTEED